MKKINFTILIISLLFPQILNATSISLNDLNIHYSNQKNYLDINFDKNKNISDQITINNLSNEQINININTENLSDFIFIQNTVSIKPHETVTIPFTVQLNKNLGVGNHQGLILFKYKKTLNNNIYNLEKGLKLNINIPGQPQNIYKIINPVLTKKKNSIYYSYNLINNGNTLLNGETSLINKTNNTQQTQHISIYPGESTKINLNVNNDTNDNAKLINTIDLNNQLKTFVLNNNIKTTPDISPLLIISLLLATGIIIYLKIKNKKSKKINYILLGIFSLIFFQTSGNINQLLKTDSFNTIPETGFLTTIKWGQFGATSQFKNNPISWNGYFKASSGKLIIIEKLHHEKGDNINLNKNENQLNFKNTTGPDNDGIILLFKPDESDQKPSLTYYNNNSQYKYTFPINSTLKLSKYLNYLNGEIEIKSEIADKNITIIQNNQEYNIDTTNISTTTPILEIIGSPETNIIFDTQSTDEIQIKENKKSLQLQEELKVLKDIIKDSPSTSDSIYQYVLNSDLIEEINSNYNSTIIKTNPLLIDKLRNSPLIINEISSSAEQNLIFVPNSKVEMPSQFFSFNQKQSTSQSLGDMVFIQNKNNPWSIYLSINNLTSTKNNLNIPASNITIIPGNIKLLNQEETSNSIQPGPTHKLTNNNDQALLATITPQNSNENTIFALNPQIILDIPAGTKPGTYRAEITIREI